MSVVLRRLLINSFSAHGLDMNNKRESVSTSVNTCLQVKNVNKSLGAIQTKAARLFCHVLSVPENSHISRKTLDAAGILVL